MTAVSQIRGLNWKGISFSRNTIQAIHHMADNDMNAYIRFKMALTEDVYWERSLWMQALQRLIGITGAIWPGSAKPWGVTMCTHIKEDFRCGA
ncbi:hypothetical protein PAJ34TS1_42270 [Paenibacillus azoreducens]|uniref:Uncharacterized protein n=1 Tax=Paenibacillus azoreducens TaxID=116718 RepID=A0A919YK05_9BACL|nr:hypothetical protein J34TS1_55150 [Paenibacillus azoreducens]